MGNGKSRRGRPVPVTTAIAAALMLLLLALLCFDCAGRWIARTCEVVWRARRKEMTPG